MVTQGEHVVGRWCAGRRAVLAGAGAAGVAGLLAACGDDPAPVAAPPAPSGAGSSPPGRSPSGPAPLAGTGDIPVGGGTVVDGLLIVQPAAGTYKAFDAACPHQGVLVAAPQGGIATCPAHKSTFAIADGARVSGPAERGLTEVAIKVNGSTIVRA